MASRDYPNPMRARRAKAVAKTQKLIGNQGTCRMYGFGVSGPNPSRSWIWIIGGSIAFCVAVAVMTGVAIVPGLLLLYFVRWSVNQPRGVCSADQGLVVTRESIWNANPKSVVALLPPDALNARIASTRTHVLVELGPDRVWLRRNEHNILLAATEARANGMLSTH